MDRDNEAFRRRVAESTAESKNSDEEETTYDAREGITRSIDPADVRERAVGDDTTRIEAQLGPLSPDAMLAGPGAIPESREVSDVAPDGTSIGSGGLTSPTGEVIGGSTLSDQIGGGGAELGREAMGSRLDPLGMLDAGGGDVGGVSSHGPGGIDSIIAGRSGGHVAADGDGVTVLVSGFDPAAGDPNDQSGWLVPDPNPPDRSGYTTDEGPVFNPPLDEDGRYWVGPDDPPPADDGGSWVGPDDSTEGFGGDDDIGTGSTAQPDPTGGYDVITQSTIDAAIKTNNPGLYAQTTADGDTHDTGASVARAAAMNDPGQLTNYGPEGEQTVGVGDWTPPPDTIFDPPPEASAMADPGPALGGASMIGSSTPDEAPPPPDPPPGGDGGDDPWGPPGGGGGEG